MVLPQDVLTGFVDAQGNALGRPVGVAVDRTGAVLVADDVGNVDLARHGRSGRRQRPVVQSMKPATSIVEVAVAGGLRLPPNHRDGVVHHTRADAEADTEHFDGKTSE